MKADVIEIHFLAGQLFTLGVAWLAIGPRMPFDDSPSTCSKSISIGGKLSYPFRRALLGLVLLGITRIMICHVLFSKNIHSIQVLDEIFETIHIVGQSFLCLTTAYLLERQLSTVINIRPGESLLRVLLVVAVLTPLGVVLAHTTGNPRFHSFAHIAQAISCYGVLNTLKVYSSIMSPSSSPSSSDSSYNNDGPFMTQLVQSTEYWFLISSILSVIGEMILVNESVIEYPAIAIFVKAIECNQDSGVDEWTRLLIHSIFLNYLDEIQHYTTTTSTTTSTTSNNNNNNGFGGSGESNNNGRPSDDHDENDDVEAKTGNNNKLAIIITTQANTTTTTTTSPLLRSRVITN